ncbi:erythromycin esterase family protein [Flagellimonas pacifica]|uniref:Erythromycin esterase n=1 Tax=Flagellimonas pacifica TaxID=1247520 RepID=A0A285MQI0_9FLAO|nr:erythromycin esterase family protein [Allomuricauda parva]SNY99442.1 erythromycin esterase [Allomuricauda parva]
MRQLNFRKPFITIFHNNTFSAIICLLLFSLYLNNISAQSKPSMVEGVAVEIGSISPGDTDFSDLMALKNIIGDTRIVLLGEQSHGGGSTYSAKVRLIKFLHQEMGFEVMAFESGMYDCAKIWQNMVDGKKMKDEVLNSMFYMYATSTEVKPLFNYMDDQMQGSKPLLFCGMDSQHTGEKSKQYLVADLKTFLDKNGSEIQNQESWKVFERKVADIIGMNRAVTDEDKADFYIVVNNLKSELSTLKSNEATFLNNSGFWKEIIHSLESQAKRYWGDIEDMDRDRQMASNMSWLLNNTHKDKKVIIWAHNFHIARGLDPILPMGHFLKKEFGDQMYAIGFTGYDGEFINFVNDKKVSIAKPSKSSIEQSIKKTGWPYAMIDFRHLAENSALKQKQKGRLFNFNQHSFVLPEVFDGLFYIETTTPTVRE